MLVRRRRLRLGAEQRHRDLGDLGRRPPDPDALALERLGLGLRGAPGAGHDRAGVAHRLARWRGEAGDVADDRLGHVVGDEVGGALLVVATDHDQFGLRVVLEQPDHVDEVGSGHRISADPDDRRVAEAALGEHVADLVGQRARARHHADVALLEERRGDDSHVGLARRQDAGAVGADQAGAAVLLDHGVGAELVVGGDALGDRDDQRNARVLGLEDRVRREPRRHEDHRGVRICAGDGLVEGVEHRDALDVLAALARRDAADHLGAVVAVAERVERALAPGDPRHAQPRVGIDEDAHAEAAASSTTFWAAPSIVDSVKTIGRFASASSWRPSTSLVPSSRTTNGTVGLIFLNASISPRATSSPRVMPPKMMNSTALTLGFDRITSTALVIASAFEPPPASRKFAGEPPASATTSSVDITSPAPLPRMPMFPSSLTNVSPRSLAIRSCGSSAEGSRSSALSGWRNSELSSSVTLASSALTSRSGVTISGLTSTNVASSVTKTSYKRASMAPTGRTTSASTPASNARRRP